MKTIYSFCSEEITPKHIIQWIPTASVKTIFSKKGDNLLAISNFVYARRTKRMSGPCVFIVHGAVHEMAFHLLKKLIDDPGVTVVFSGSPMLPGDLARRVQYVFSKDASYREINNCSDKIREPPKKFPSIVHQHLHELGLSADDPCIDLKTVKKRYRDLALEHHPDKKIRTNSQHEYDDFVRIDFAFKELQKILA